MPTPKNHPEYQYLNLLDEILKDGIRKVDRGTDVVLYSLFGRQTRYDLSQGFPLLTTKRVYWKGVLQELYWFMKGDSNIKYLVDNNVHIWDDYPIKIYNWKRETNKKLPELTKEEFIEKIATDDKFAKKWGELPKIYGESWRRWPTRNGRTIDQLGWVLQELKDDPDAKNLIVNSWNPEYLYTMATHEDASRFPICHNMYQISNRNGKLSLQLYQRSADMFLGVPFNIASYALLTIILARIMGLEPGEFIHTFGDVHIYENHIEQVKEQLSRTPKPLPTIKLDPSVVSLDTFTPDKVTLENYDPHPGLKGELTVAGGLYEGKKKKEIILSMNKPRLSLIAALSENRVIGINNALPWHIPGDLKRFKDLTSGHPVIMGRKTFESLGRVLPNRTNIVITRDIAKFNEEAKKTGLSPEIVVPSLDEAIEKAKESFGSEEEIFVIGGGQIFKQAIPIADRLYLTIVHKTLLGDAYFPEYDMFTKEIERIDEKGDEFDYTYLTLERSHLY